MIDRLRCLIGKHNWEFHQRRVGNVWRTWRFCRRPNCHHFDMLPAEVIPQ